MFVTCPKRKEFKKYILNAIEAARAVALSNPWYSQRKMHVRLIIIYREQQASSEDAIRLSERSHPTLAGLGWGRITIAFNTARVIVLLCQKLLEIAFFGSLDPYQMK